MAGKCFDVDIQKIGRRLHRLIRRITGGVTHIIGAFG